MMLVTTTTALLLLIGGAGGLVVMRLDLSVYVDYSDVSLKKSGRVWNPEY